MTPPVEMTASLPGAAAGKRSFHMRIDFFRDQIEPWLKEQGIGYRARIRNERRGPVALSFYSDSRAMLFRLRWL